MHRHLGIFIGFIMVVLLIKLAIAEQVGLMPVPIFTYAKVESQVAYDSATGLYTYSYTITNPATNTGEIIHIDIDITRPSNSVTLSSEGLTIPIGKKIKTFDEVIAMTNNPKLSLSLVPVGELVPSGWTGGLAQFGSKTGGDRITPGETQSGFEIISRGLPSIREIELVPKWVLLVESEEMVTQEEKQRASQIEDFLPYKTKTIAPTAPPNPNYFSPFDFLNTIKSYVNDSATLGWIKDQSLKDSLLAQLTSVRTYLDANDPTLAKTILQQFMDTTSQASSSQRTTDAYGLLYYNAKYLISQLPDTYVPPPGMPPPSSLPQPVTVVDISPKETTLAIGETVTLTITVTQDGNPLNNAFVVIIISSGPNANWNKNVAVSTGTQGTYTFSYTGKVTGIDHAEVYEVVSTSYSFSCSPGTGNCPATKVNWKAGPDLIIDLFIPPMIKSQGGSPITITDITGNHGDYQASASVTRYYLSYDETIDPHQDIYLGERTVPALAVEESSNGGELQFSLPSYLSQGTYYLGACADADETVAELDERNNCEINKLSLVVPLEPLPNQPPDCTKAVAAPDNLWPANHSLSAISITGVTDPDGDNITMTITKISQDEPTNGLGDGDMSPDGFGVGSSQAQVRAERSGTGNGRVYAISFTADDGKGGTCSGNIQVGVPHDKGKGKNPVDDGQNYDSTMQ